LKDIRIKKTTKLFLLLVLIVLVSALFTGCGFAGADNTNEKTEFNNGLGSKNNFCLVWKNAISSTNKGGSGSEKKKGVWAVSPIDATQSYGSEVGKNSGITITRDIAIFMYNSLFGGGYPYDTFSGNHKFGEITLNPKDIIVASNNSMSGAIAKGGNLDALSTSVKGMAEAIFVAVWLMGALQQIVNEKWTPETMLKTFMQFILAILLIENATMIVQLMSDAGTALVNEAAGSMGGAGKGDAFAKFAQGISDILKEGIIVVSAGISVGESSMLQIGIGTIWFD
jgi:hypothetical protein